MKALARRPSALVLLLGVCVAWGAMLSQGTRLGVQGSLGPLALVVLAAALALRVPMANDRGWPAWQAIGAGLGLGALMTVATYPAYALVAGYLPTLPSDVAALYALVRAGSGWLGLAWTTLIVVAEEWIWREALLTQLRRRLGLELGIVASLALYAGVQLVSGSWVVVALAFSCGAVWTAARLTTGTVLTPIAAHLVWTFTVLIWRPVV